MAATKDALVVPSVHPEDMAEGYAPPMHHVDLDKNLTRPGVQGQEKPEGTQRGGEGPYRGALLFFLLREACVDIGKEVREKDLPHLE